MKKIIKINFFEEKFNKFFGDNNAESQINLQGNKIKKIFCRDFFLSDLIAKLHHFIN